MKGFLICSLIFMSFASYTQLILPDNFKIGNFFEVYNRDSLRIYFNCTGTIVDKKCASFYRIGRMDTVIVNFVGEFYDFDLDDNLIFKAKMINNNIEGYACYYFKNGKISEEGYFKNNARTGKWKYYYPNGQVEKIYSYEGDEPNVLEAYKKNGTPTIIDGNGIIHTEFRNYKQCTGFEVWGSIVRGKKNGEWTASNYKAVQPITKETYRDGIFIEGGLSDSKYTKDPAIKLSKYYPNEDLNLVRNSFGCEGQSGIYFLRYDGKDISSAFYPKLQEDVTREVNLNLNSIRNQWIIVGIKIDKNDLIQEINLASSINDIDLENKIYGIIEKMNKWKAALISAKPVDSSIYFSILVVDNHVIVLPLYL